MQTVPKDTNIKKIKGDLLSIKGVKGIKDAFTYGAKVTGVTIHFVNEKMDSGPIILQEGVKITEKEYVELKPEEIEEIIKRFSKR